MEDIERSQLFRRKTIKNIPMQPIIRFVDQAPIGAGIFIPWPRARKRFVNSSIKKKIIMAAVALLVKFCLELIIPRGDAIRVITKQLKGRAHR